MKLSQKIRVPFPELKFLKPVFERLKHIHQQYIDRVGDNDIPYWYGERSHIGFLAAAVWRSRGIALEEFCRDKGKKRKGRCDLYIKFGPKKQFHCEAKLCKKLDQVKKKFKQAQDETRRMLSKEEPEGLALLFLTPSVREAKLADYYKRLPKLTETLSKQCDLFVQISIRERAEVARQRGANKFPGLLLLVKQVPNAALRAGEATLRSEIGPA